MQVDVLDGEAVVASQAVDFHQPMILDVAPADHPRLRVSIDNAGSPDSDWINVHLR